MTKLLKLNLQILLILLPLTLTGCIKAETSITVNSDGTGILTSSLGFPIELVGEMTLHGIDPVKDLKQFLFNDLRRGTEFSQDDDTDYEWLIITHEFTSVEDLSDLVQQQDFVESFTLQRNRGFLQDRYVLDARLVPENYTNPFETELGDDIGDVISQAKYPLDFLFSIKLPGDVVETNGVHDATANTITWSADSNDPIELHAITDSWNTLSLAVTGGLALLGIALLITIILLVIRSRRKSKPGVDDPNVRQRLVESVQTVEEEEQDDLELDKEEVFAPSKILAMVGAREHLDQVNQHVLNNRGEITVAKGAIRLEWSDTDRDTAVSRGIIITVKDTETIMINGVPFPATREAARDGLISCLKGLTQQ
jgi:hypothetical protein